MNNLHNFARLKKLQTNLPNATALIVSDPSTIEYLSGFHTLVPNEREAILMISSVRTTLLYAHFSPLPLGVERVENLKTIPGCRPQLLAGEVEKMVKAGIETFMIDKDSLFVAEYEAMKNVSGTDFEDMKDGSLIWNMRMIKDNSEIAKIKTASEISIKAFQDIVEMVAPGVTEFEIGQALDAKIRALGGDLAFPTIIAFGANTALPHHQPSDTKRLEQNMPVLIDWGAKYQGYCADMTRSWWHGPDVDPDYQKIADVVRHAHDEVLRGLQEALSAEIKITASDLDHLARSIIDDAGFGNHFIHTTGHGLGLNIHEPPSLNSQNQTEIVSGMVFTVEPGIYLQDKYGYRYEHTIVINDNIAEKLAEYEINYE